ncbi:MAG: type II secretion system F family protein, partial [Acidimicrobiia bacterium]
MSVFAVLFGLGVFLVYDAWTSEPRVRGPRDRGRTGPATQLLLEAGYPGISVRQLTVASVAAGLGA